MQLPTSMRAMAIEQFGGPEVIKPVTLPCPVAGDNDLLIQVEACGLNPVDFKIRHDGLGASRPFPAVLGYDVAGVVRGMGRSVQGFKEGDAVFAMLHLNRQGGNAEFVVSDYRMAAKRPKNLSAAEAAAVPIAGLTAWEALVERAKIQKGQTVLITAGVGGVGHFAVQIAKLHGCRVMATAGRKESLAFLKELGADVVIDYSKEDVVARVMTETNQAGADVCFDCVGGPGFEQALRSVAIHGQVINIVGGASDAVAANLFLKNATLHYEFVGSWAFYGQHMERPGQELAKLAELIEHRKIKVHVSRTWKLSELAEAHRAQQEGRTIGKMVIQLN
ncbi:MAG TPA: zinc-binding dehydrogenase [Opitutales bacterium]|nr:zinc-binding dehydrogenase [Opitutales bacterium]